MEPNPEIEFSLEQSKAWWRLLDPKYKEITRIIFGGAAGSGKSVLISLYTDYMAITFPGCRGYLARETLKDIKESILLTFFDITKMTGSKYKYREDKSKITYPNGSEIYLLETMAYPSDPNFERFGSREYTFGCIEEGINTHRRAADLLISRTRYKHDEFELYPKQLITCNPGDGWIKDDIVIPQLEGKPNKKALFIPATLSSNPNKKFAESYADTLQSNLSAFDLLRLLGGDWNARQKTGAEYFKEFSADKHANFINEYNPDLPLHITFDENVNPHITCQIWQIFKEGNLRTVRMIDEICPRPPLNTRKRVCDTILQKYPGHRSGMFIYGDATSQKNDTAKEYGENFFTDILSYLSKYNPSLRVPSKNPGVVSRAGFINLIFEKEYRGIKVEVNRDCKIAISDFANALEDEEGAVLKKRVTDPDTGVSYEKYGHACDAFCYFICECFLSDFDYYLSGGIKYDYTIGNDRQYSFRR